MALKKYPINLTWLAIEKAPLIKQAGKLKVSPCTCIMRFIVPTIQR